MGSAGVRCVVSFVNRSLSAARALIGAGPPRGPTKNPRKYAPRTIRSPAATIAARVAGFFVSTFLMNYPPLHQHSRTFLTFMEPADRIGFGCVAIRDGSINKSARDGSSEMIGS